MSKHVIGRLNTDSVFIQSLIADLKNGEVKVPQFQRKFVWKEEQALKLLDSIANNYPIGSLLLWKTNDKLAIERNIGDFRLPETEELTPTDYVLDGQQRLTVIYSCLGALDTDEGFASGYDLESEKFIEMPKDEDSKSTIFPMRWIYQTTKLLNFRTALSALQNSDKYQERLDSLIGTIANYKIPVVTLKDMTVEEVCPIFERINSSGTSLSTFDLMVAATWSTDFDLNEKVEVISDDLDPKGYSDIEGNTILKCLSAIKYKGIKKEQLLSLRNLSADEMNELVEEARESLKKATDLLSTEFKIYSIGFLPYEAQIVILCYIYSQTGVLSEQLIKRVREWFWRSGFGEGYRGASEHYISQHLELIHEYVINGTGDPEVFGVIPSEETLKKSLFISKSSRSRALVLMLAHQQAKNLTNGSVVDISEALSNFNKRHFHHVYPRAYLKRERAKGEANSIVNICLLSASENIAISDNDPHVYLSQCVSALGDDADKVFASNLLPLPSETDFSLLGYSDFLDRRAQLLSAEIKRLCSGAH